MKRRESDSGAQQELGRRLEAARVNCGWSRSQLARKSGIGRRDIGAFEQGTGIPTAQQLATLAVTCGATADDLVRPEPDVTLVAGAVAGSATGALNGDAAYDSLLREYLSMLLELRRASTIAPVSLRQEDLTELAKALGGTPERIEARLVELLGTDAQGASEMRDALLPTSAA